MLTRLGVRNVVLIDRLDLPLCGGLGVLTGETGAGKSILLDALGLAIGARGNSGLVRPGCDAASVTAEFDVPQDHPARMLLAENDLPVSDAKEPLILRRTLDADGRSRGYVDDQSVSISLLRRCGESLVEVHGQFDGRGIADRSVHGPALDRFAGLSGLCASTGEAFRAWRTANQALEEALAAVAKATEREAELRRQVSTLVDLAPEEGEHERLRRDRDVVRNAAMLAEAMDGALRELSEEGGASDRLRGAERLLEKTSGLAEGFLDETQEALSRAQIETEEALRSLQAAAAKADASPAALERIEARLFAYQGAARQQAVPIEELPTRLRDLEAELSALEEGDDHIATLEAAASAAREIYLERAGKLGKQRRKAVKKLEKAVVDELQPLRLDSVRFVVSITTLEPEGWGGNGCEQVEFLVSTVPDAEPGPIARIASGGERARLMLALKLILAGEASTLVFDEVDAGVGGATAYAVGERLKKLGADLQVLVVTHSPQVAARGDGHFRVDREKDGKTEVTRITPLEGKARREEVARMLAGTSVTEEARHAAGRLMRGEAA